MQQDAVHNALHSTSSKNKVECSGRKGTPTFVRKGELEEVTRFFLLHTCREEGKRDGKELFGHSTNKSWNYFASLSSSLFLANPFFFAGKLLLVERNSRR